MKKYKIIIPVIPIMVLLVMFITQIHAANSYPIANGGEVYTAEDFVYALGGDEIAYNNGDIIILKSDLSIENPIIIKSGDYEIQGTGCHIEFIGGGFIIDGGVLTLGNDKGSDDHPSLTFEGNGNVVNAVQINNGTLNIYVGTLITGFADSPIKMTNGRTISMYGGVITGNTAELGGAIYIENGDLVIMQGTISENSAVDGGAIYSVNGYINMVSPVIHNNTATENGGAIWNGNGDLNISNGSYQYNEAKNAGFIYNNGIVTIGGGTYSYNKAVNGGVVVNYNELNILNVNNTSMSFNEAEVGAVIYNHGLFNLEDAQIAYNTSELAGGAIVNFGEFHMNGGSVSMNETNESGGGVANFGEFTMLGGSISSNKAKNAKGIYNSGKLILGGHCFISFNNDVEIRDGGTIEVIDILTANTPVATLTFDESKYIEGTQIITGDEAILTSASEKIAITRTDKGTWSIDIDGKLIFTRDPLTLPYQIVIAVSAVIVIAVVVIISVRIGRRRKK